jgi:hypothetical protein
MLVRIILLLPEPLRAFDVKFCCNLGGRESTGVKCCQHLREPAASLAANLYLSQSAMAFAATKYTVKILLLHISIAG